MTAAPACSFDKKQLMLLIAVQEQRLSGLQKTMQELQVECNQLDNILNLIAADEAKVEAQRLQWQQEWQNWLQNQGTVWKSNGHNNRHQQLTILENLLKEHRTDITAQKAAVLERMALQSALLVRQQIKLDSFVHQFQQLQKAQWHRHEAKHTSSADEHSLSQWFGQSQAALL